MERVFTRRTDQIQLSMRTVSPLAGRAASAAATSGATGGAGAVSAAVSSWVCAPPSVSAPSEALPDAMPSTLVLRVARTGRVFPVLVLMHGPQPRLDTWSCLRVPVPEATPVRRSTVDVWTSLGRPG